MKIRFGTGGWRGILGEDFTFPRSRAVVRAAGEWIARGRPGARVVVAHDTRFLADRFAEEAAAVLAGCGLRPLLAAGPVATPVAARSVLRRHAAAGLVFTASHNPPEYLGLKVFGERGSLPGSVTRGLERRAEVWLRRRAPLGRVPGRRMDLVSPYLEDLLASVDRSGLRRARLSVVYDALHGAGAGVVDRALARSGVRVAARRLTADPRFGGHAPDPTRATLADLAAAARRARVVGLATDGDADRFAVIDESGRLLSETQALALLVDHLVARGRISRGVAISVATGSLVERVAAAHGLAVERHPIGFKHLSQALAAGRVDVAGEESGGFAWSGFGYDKDGILASLLLAERVALEGLPLAAQLRALERRHGRSVCGRQALPARPARVRALARLRRAPPGRVGVESVRGVEGQPRSVPSL